MKQALGLTFGLPFGPKAARREIPSTSAVAKIRVVTCPKVGAANFTGASAKLRQIGDMEADTQQKPRCWHKTLAIDQIPSKVEFAFRGQG
jgi:hypothetical protein